jgi:hypothetical protein
MRAQLERQAGELWTAAQNPENRNSPSARERWVRWLAAAAEHLVEQEVARRLQEREGRNE